MLRMRLAYRSNIAFRTSEGDGLSGLRISVIVTGCFGHRDRFAAALDTGGIVLLRAVTISQVIIVFAGNFRSDFAHRFPAQFQSMRAM